MNDHDGNPVPGGRGLYDYAQITDTYRSEIRVRKSSAACEPCVWIFTERDGREYAEHPPSATRLRNALDRFIQETTPRRWAGTRGGARTVRRV